MRRKKRAALLSTLALLLLLPLLLPAAAPGVSAGAYSYGADGSSGVTYVSVGLKYASSAVSSCELQSSDGFQVVDIRDGMRETLPLPGYDRLVVTVRQGLLTVSDENGATLIADLGENSVIMNGDYLGEGVFTFAGKEYRGGLRFHLRGNSMNVINYLSLDHYLYGVLQGEMGHLSPLEALKAQAVAARSYAVANISAHRSEGFELCANSHCQMYYGVSVEYPETVQAVDETSELILYYGGKPVAGFYHKNSGGYTQNSEDVWTAAEGYLRSVRDSWCPDYTWRAEFSWDQLSSKVSGIGRISDAYISRWTENGNVLEMTFVGSGGTKTLSKESIRMTLGSSAVKSLNFVVEGGSGAGGSFSPGANGSGSGSSSGSNGSGNNGSGDTSGNTSGGGNGNGSSSGDISVTVRGEKTSVSRSDFWLRGSEETREMMSLEDIYVRSDDGVQALSESGFGANALPSSEFGVAASSAAGVPVQEGQAVVRAQSVSSKGIVLSGKGYGHSIGMCQDSAILMARDGMDFEEILHFFYTDVDIDYVGY